MGTFSYLSFLFLLLLVYIGLPALAFYGLTKLATRKSMLPGLLPILLILILGIVLQTCLLHAAEERNYRTLSMPLANGTRAEVVACVDGEETLTRLSDLSVYDERDRLVDTAGCEDEDFLPITRALLENAGLALPPDVAAAIDSPADTGLYDGSLDYLSTTEIEEALTGEDDPMLHIGNTGINRRFIPVATAILCGLLLLLYGLARREVLRARRELELQKSRLSDLN